MFYRQQSNQYINQGVPFVIDGVQYPQNWLNLSTPEEKAALGLEEVLTVGESKDSRYYWTGETLEGAVRTLTATAKDLDQVKKEATAQVKHSAFTILQPTDYIEVRNLRDSEYKPNWIVWRDSIRQTSSTTCNAIIAADNVDTVESIIKSIDWPVDPNVEE
jgi:hypothetical protein